MTRAGLLLILACVGATQSTDAAAQRQAVVWAVGDAADGSDEARAVAQSIEADGPDALLYLGDVYPHGTAADFAERYHPVYGGLKAITWPTPGNHEWGNRATGYYPYWGARLGRRPWYRVRMAGWELLSLNSEARHDRRSRQVRWLRRLMARATGTCRLAFWHSPRFSAGSEHGDDPSVAPLWSALRGKARLVVNAHDHVMLRYKRRDGMTQYVSGAGGYTLYDVEPDPRTAFARGDTRGALRIALARGRASLEFRTPSGEVLDRSSARCRPQNVS
jgi:hypothetical protein